MSVPTESLDYEGRALAWQRVHDVSVSDAYVLAHDLPATDPRRVHYAALALSEWRAGRGPALASDWAIAYRTDAP